MNKTLSSNSLLRQKLSVKKRRRNKMKRRPLLHLLPCRKGCEQCVIPIVWASFDLFLVLLFPITYLIDRAISKSTPLSIRREDGDEADSDRYSFYIPLAFRRPFVSGAFRPVKSEKIVIRSRVLPRERTFWRKSSPTLRVSAPCSAK